VALAARKVRAKALRIAGEALEVDPRDLEVTDGVVHVRGTPQAQIALKTVAVLANPLRYAFDAEAARATQFAVGGSLDKPPVADDDEPGLEATDYYSPLRSTFANGVHAAVVETDPDTAEIKVLRYCVVHDCGTLINPMIVEGQVHGGIAHGIGNAFLEEIVYDRAGQLMTGTLMDYALPRAADVPRLEVHHVVTPSPLNPLGVKGAGEGGTLPAPAAIANAVADALRPLGVAVTEMPLTRERLWRRMQAS